MKPTGATKEATVTTEWTLSKPLTNQIIGNDLRKGLIGTMPAYGIDVPDKEGRTHFAGVLVFGNEQRAKDIVTAINERERLRIAVTALIRRFQREYHDLTDGQFGSVEDFPEVKQLRAALNDATPGTSAGGG